MDAVTPLGPSKPGIYYDLDEEVYHAGQGVSKSGLWIIDTKSPAHFKFGEQKEGADLDLGKALHFSILQPEEFEAKVFKGPVDRRGNKWTDAEEWCKSAGKLLLTAGQYEKAETIRDAVHADTYINNLITGGDGVVEMSAYWLRNGVLCKCRPDFYRRDIGVVVDLKSALSANPHDFARSVVNYGYHVQEAWYTDGLNEALGATRAADTYTPATDEDPASEVKGMAAGGVQGFLFLAFEKEAPYAAKLYELPPSIVSEGRAIADRAFETYAKCKAEGRWPAYGDDVTELRFPRWAYKLTKAPDNADADV